MLDLKSNNIDDEQIDFFYILNILEKFEFRFNKICLHKNMMCSGSLAPSKTTGVCECQKLSYSGSAKCQKLSA